MAENLATLDNAENDVARLLVGHEDTSVRYAVATNSNTPWKWLQSLHAHFDPDVAVAAASNASD